MIPLVKGMGGSFSFRRLRFSFNVGSRSGTIHFSYCEDVRQETFTRRLLNSSIRWSFGAVRHCGKATWCHLSTTMLFSSASGEYQNRVLKIWALLHKRSMPTDEDGIGSQAYIVERLLCNLRTQLPAFFFVASATFSSPFLDGMNARRYNDRMPSCLRKNAIMTGLRQLASGLHDSLTPSWGSDAPCFWSWLSLSVIERLIASTRRTCRTLRLASLLAIWKLRMP